MNNLGLTDYVFNQWLLYFLGAIAFVFAMRVLVKSIADMVERDIKKTEAKNKRLEAEIANINAKTIKMQADLMAMKISFLDDAIDNAKSKDFDENMEHCYQSYFFVEMGEEKILSPVIQSALSNKNVSPQEFYELLEELGG